MWRFCISISIVALIVAPSATPAVAQDAPPVGPVFRQGEAQPVFDPKNVVRENLFVTAPVDSDHDGQDDQVHVVVVRPKATEQGMRVPVVYQASPYFAGLNAVANHNVDTELHVPDAAAGHYGLGGPKSRSAGIGSDYEEYLLSRGYAVVYAESLGTGQSTGCPTAGGANETIGARSVVDWLNSRARAHDSFGAPVSARWSTGKVGMIGTSYDGTLANAVASTGVAGLEAIVPIAAISDWYDYYRQAGAVVAPGGYQGEDADVLARAVNTRPDRARCEPEIDRIAGDEDRSTGDYNNFWIERNYLDHVGNVHAAVLAAQGLDDWNVKTRQTAQWYSALAAHNVPHKIWWHQFGHVDPLTVRRGEWLRTVNRWFTRYLYGVPNGVEAEPHASVQRTDGSWVEQSEWPAERARQTSFQLTRGGAVAGGLTRTPHIEGTILEELSDDASIRAEDLANAPSSPHRLAYFSTPTDRSERLSGTASARLAVEFDRPAANVTTLLVDRGPDGSTRLITRGWADPQNRVSQRWTSPVRPGARYSIDVEMQPEDYVLPAGHRWGLVVLSSDRDFTLCPAPGTRLRLDLQESGLYLPLVADG
jgi:X-Pro dipeptidyl-peptidase